MSRGINFCDTQFERILEENTCIPLPHFARAKATNHNQSYARGRLSGWMSRRHNRLNHVTELFSDRGKERRDVRERNFRSARDFGKEVCMLGIFRYDGKGVRALPF